MHITLSRYVREVPKMILLLGRKRLHVHHGQSLTDTLLQEHLVYVPAVVLRFNDRLKRWGHPLVDKIFPAELAEPFVPLNVLGILYSPRGISV